MNFFSSNKVFISHISINEFDRIYEEIIIALISAFNKIGIDVRLSKNTFDDDCLNILVGSTIFASRHLNLQQKLKHKKFLIYQLEPLHEEFGLLKNFPEYYELLKASNWIWDYSPQSKSFLNSGGINHVSFLPPSYDDSLEKYSPDSAQDIDIIFIGSPHPRRTVILDQLKALGYNVIGLSQIFGRERDYFTSRSKIVLNIHAWDNINNLETVRISYLLANKSFVISENSDHNPYGSGLIFASYNDLVEICVKWLKKERHERDSVAIEGYENNKKILMTDQIKLALNEINLATK